METEAYSTIMGFWGDVFCWSPCFCHLSFFLVLAFGDLFVSFFCGEVVVVYTLQGINISHLGKRKIIFKYALSGGYVNFLEGISIVRVL